MRYWCRNKGRQCEFANFNGYCMITACVKEKYGLKKPTVTTCRHASLKEEVIK